jgi:predicted ATPase
LCHLLHSPLLLYSSLIGQWRYCLIAENLTATMQIAQRVYSLAQEQNSAALAIGACRAMACTLYFSGEFEPARRYATRGIQLWRSGGVPSPVEELNAPAVSCLYYKALSGWHLGEIVSCSATMAEAISLAHELKDAYALALALCHAAFLAHYERTPAEVERLASNLIELSSGQNFAFWVFGGAILRGWARSVSGDSVEGLAEIEDGIGNWRATGSTLIVPYWLALKAEALHLADRTSKALEVIREAEAVLEKSEQYLWRADLHRLRGVFLTAMGSDETQIEAAFREAIRTASQQKSISLTKRAEASRAEYRNRKGKRAEPSGGTG